MSKRYVGSIESGGTKFVCAIGDEDLNIIDKVSFPTTTPEETLAQTVAYFKNHELKVSAIAIASFGPVDINVNSATYGYITRTPKPNWSFFDLLGYIAQEIDVPITITSDVNGSVYGEYELGVANGKQSAIYFTIGTGVGGGAIQDGVFIGGRSHSEMGHIFVRRHPADLDFPGICPFHGDCLEGVTCGPTIEARYGIKGEHLPQDHEIWDILGYYVAQAAYTATLMFSPDVIIFGGSVSRPLVIEKAKGYFKEIMNDYVPTPPLDEYIVTTNMEDNSSATVGCFALARNLVS
ncbi:MAG: ROK family protein [Clostridiales Family XIII bacterium]|jgi:fructokinase|nr:ROK family protein [Clostridiales Family XIII bacterium]